MTRTEKLEKILQEYFSLRTGTTSLDEAVARIETLYPDRCDICIMRQYKARPEEFCFCKTPALAGLLKNKEPFCITCNLPIRRKDE